jgi:hypothetical protein
LLIVTGNKLEAVPMWKSAVSRVAVLGLVAVLVGGGCIGRGTPAARRNAYIVDGLMVAGGATLVAVGASAGSDDGDVTCHGSGFNQVCSEELNFDGILPTLLGTSLVIAGVVGVIATAADRTPEAAPTPAPIVAATPAECRPWRAAIAQASDPIERATLERDQPRSCAKLRSPSPARTPAPAAAAIPAHCRPWRAAFAQATDPAERAALERDQPAACAKLGTPPPAAKPVSAATSIPIECRPWRAALAQATDPAERGELQRNQPATCVR